MLTSGPLWSRGTQATETECGAERRGGARVAGTPDDVRVSPWRRAFRGQRAVAVFLVVPRILPSVRLRPLRNEGYGEGSRQRVMV